MKAINDICDLELNCPYCGHEHNPMDHSIDLVTYWGDGPIHVECAECGKTIVVTEVVTRSYRIEKLLRT